MWVRQHLAQHDPDVDAIYRLTSPLPVYFTAERSTGLVLPVNTFVPYNAQATFHYHEVGKAEIFQTYRACTILSGLLWHAVAHLHPRQGLRHLEVLCDPEADVVGRGKAGIWTSFGDAAQERA